MKRKKAGKLADGIAELLRAPRSAAIDLATNIMRLLHRALGEVRHGVLSRKETKKALLSFFKKIAQTCPAESGVDAVSLACVTRFLSRKYAGKGRKGLSLSSVCTQFVKLRNALIFAHKRNKEITRLTLEDLREFSTEHRSSLAVLRQLLREEATEVDLDDPSLIKGKKRGFLAYFEIDFTSKEFAALATNEKTVLLIGRELFLRNSEIACLGWERIVLDGPMPGVTVVGKGLKERFVSLATSPTAFDHLRRLGDVREGYVVRKRNGSPYSSAGIHRLCQRGLSKMGLPVENEHHLRHLGIDAASRKSEDLAEVSARAGHALLETTIHEYIHSHAECALEVCRENHPLRTIFGSRARLLSVSEVADMLGLGMRSIQHHAESGMLRGVKLKGEWRFEQADVLLLKVRRRWKGPKGWWDAAQSRHGNWRDKECQGICPACGNKEDRQEARKAEVVALYQQTGSYSAVAKALEMDRHMVAEIVKRSSKETGGECKPNRENCGLASEPKPSPAVPEDGGNSQSGKYTSKKAAARRRE